MQASLNKGSETFRKRERICSGKDVSELLSMGKFGLYGCMKFCVLRRNEKHAHRIRDIHEIQDVHRVMVSVSKKLFRRAVKRNLLKRRIRECYRRLKHILPEGGGIDILLIYNSYQIADYQEIYRCVENILTKIATRC